MSESFLIGWWSGKQFIIAYADQVPEKGSLKAITLDQGSVKIKKEKLQVNLSWPWQEQEAKQGLALAHESAQEQYSDDDLALVWEMLSEEEGLPLEHIADYLTAANPLGLALLQLRLAETSFFVRKNDVFYPRSKKDLEVIRTQQNAEQRKNEGFTKFKAWADTLWLSPEGFEETVFPEDWEEDFSRWLAWTKDVVVFGKDSRRFEIVQELFHKTKISLGRSGFRFLVKAGLFSEDEPIELHRARVAQAFSEEAQTALSDLEQLYEEQLKNYPLIEETLYTIDDEQTRDYDDAIGLQVQGDQYLLTIAIADVSAIISPKSLLDSVAKERVTSIYLPDQTIPMIPKELSESLCSLVEQTERLVLLGRFTLAKDGTLLETQWQRGKIKVAKQYTYQEIDKAIEEGDTYWNQLWSCSKALEAQRWQRGASRLPFSRFTIKVKDSTISLNSDNSNSPSQTIVSECMILYNNQAAELLNKHKAPGIFRSQPEPDEPIPIQSSYTLAEVFRFRKKFKRGEIGLKPSSHSSLGLSSYIQVTSPIRRYLDLVMQRQLLSILEEQTPYYTEEQLNTFYPWLLERSRELSQLERSRNEYYLLKYLEQQEEREYQAEILTSVEQGVLVVLHKNGYECVVSRNPQVKNSPGTQVWVRLESIWPRERLVRGQIVEFA